MATYNRYRGNGSRAEKIQEPPSRNPNPSGRGGGNAMQPKCGVAPQPQPSRNAPRQNGLSLQKLPILGDLPKKLGELETEDLLLILILYLMYRESGDKELLIIMGAMYLF